MGYLRRPSGEVVLDPDEQAQGTIRLVFDLFQRFRTVGRVLRYLVEHDIRMPVRTPGGPAKGELEWHHANRPSLHNLLAIRSMPASMPTVCGRPIGDARSRDGRAPGGVRRVLTKRKYFCRIVCLPTFLGSSSSVTRSSSAPIGQTMWGRCGPAPRC